MAVRTKSEIRDRPPRLKVTNLRWAGDHDALAAGYWVTLECGCTQWRPTNILCCSGIAKSLREKGTWCRNGHTGPKGTK
jgi:hypothetical protein